MLNWLDQGRIRTQLCLLLDYPIQYKINKETDSTKELMFFSDKSKLRVTYFENLFGVGYTIDECTGIFKNRNVLDVLKQAYNQRY